jgi:lauroyl/myristoyl acyltransferase
LRPDTSNSDAKEEAVRLTKEAMRLIDEQVRLRPGDWFWYNKRWILEPPRR